MTLDESMELGLQAADKLLASGSKDVRTMIAQGYVMGNAAGSIAAMEEMQAALAVNKIKLM